MSNYTTFDWFAFRNETAARIMTAMKVDENTSMRYDNELVATRAIEAANELTKMLSATKRYHLSIFDTTPQTNTDE